ncbi:MAG: polymer-forming cytoskeletal protein [Gammaproteobacteria bacterium]|nr:polymer-forming cytoskeletal protein [Gammaproteobacteria bacterium]
MSSEDRYSPLNDSDAEPSVPLAGYLSDISSEVDANETVDDHLSDISSEVNPTESVDGDQMSVIGPTLVIKGELEAGENLLVQGRIEGTITHNAESLIIGERGTVQANIKARNVVIEGTVEGDIYGSESVSIRETAKVKGNIFTPRISITEGAHFKGGIDMDERPESVTTH